jgi:hypothetical protein
VTSNLPLVMIDEPGPFDPVETWEQFLAEVQAMTDFHGKASIIDKAKWLILQKKDALGARP